MADFDNQPSPPPPSRSPSPPPPDPKPPLPAAGKPPIKRKFPPTTNSPPHKRPNIPPPPPSASASSSGDVQNTASSKPKGNPERDDLEILESIMEHHTKYGKSPFESAAATKGFILGWTIMGIGTEQGWKERIEKLKAKFTLESQPVEEEDRKEFDMWMKIWGNEGGDEHDPGGAGALGV